MTTATYRRVNGGRLTRAAAFALLALAATLLQTPEARAQWTTSGNTTSTGNNVGVGTAAPQQTFHVNAPTEILSTGTGAGFKFRDRGSETSADDWVWYSSGNVARFWRSGPGDLLGINTSGFFGIGTINPLVRLDVNGAANIWGGARFAVPQGYMAPGSLTLGNTGANFGGGSGWSTNSAGLMLETADNTEIAVHDAGTRLASFMYFEGAAANRLTIGRDMGFGAIGTVSINGSVGVGTATPGKRLDVNGSIFAGNSLSLGKGVTNYAGIGFNRDVDTGAILSPNYNAYQMHREEGSNKFIFTAYNASGTFLGYPLTFDSLNVGVGTSSPAHRLDVAGNANAAGLCIAGDCKTAWSQVGGSQWTTSGSGVVYNSGNVGIGTASAAARLDVMGAANVWGGARYAVANGHMAPGSLTVGNINANFGGGSLWGTNTAGLMLETADNTEIVVHDAGQRLASFMYFEGGAANRVTIGRDMGWGGVNTVAINGNVGVGTTAPAAKLHVAGDIRVDGNINAKYQDVAEWVPSTQKLSAGTVVVVDPEGVNGVLASASAYDTGVAGVVSEQPGLILGDEGEGKVKVATTGRVRVKVDATSAPIRAGDLLVSGEREGYAMKSQPVMLGKRKMHSPGTIIGKALEPLEKGTGEILVLLSLQ